MTSFPKLEGSQVALARAQKTTGIILDDEFNVHISDSQIVYTIFQGVQQALDYVEKIKSSRDDVEFLIYDKDQVVLSFIP